MNRFPDGFLWGAATSAYQVEGSPLADGAGASTWHRFAHTAGNTARGETGDVACDHYRRYLDDVRLMQELGLRAYRFSVSWSRVLPEGRGRVNPKGLDFYARLVDALLEHDIEPSLTLFHWDLPAALDDRGGWLNPDIADWFADYATTLYRAFGDRVAMWATLNEPWVVVDAGYLHGIHAPGHRNRFEAPIAAHNLLRAHAAAVRAHRAEGAGRVGLVVNLEPKVPATDSPADHEAARRADAYMNRWFLDPVFRGHYPAEMAEVFADAWPGYDDAELEPVREPIDFLGINFYKRGVTRDDPDAGPVRASLVPRPENPHTAMGSEWEVYPPALTEVLLWVQRRYGDPVREAGRELPLYVTENGAAFYDPPRPLDGRVDDPLRVHYLREHLCAALRAIEQGADLRGYFAWSLLDNFEWSAGYEPRFGLVHVERETLRRTPKASAYFYRDLIRGGAIG